MVYGTLEFRTSLPFSTSLPWTIPPYSFLSWLQAKIKSYMEEWFPATMFNEHDHPLGFLFTWRTCEDDLPQKSKAQEKA